MHHHGLFFTFYRKVKETSASTKLGEIPADFLPDISYTDSIEEVCVVLVGSLYTAVIIKI